MTDKMGRGGYAVFLVAVLGFQAVLLLLLVYFVITGNRGFTSGNSTRIQDA